MGPLVDNLNFYPVAADCLTGEDITPNDFRLPFGISSAGQLLMVLLIATVLNMEVPKPEKKLAFKEEFSWVKKFAIISFLNCDPCRYSIRLL
jgi:hypothetical protein